MKPFHRRLVGIAISVAGVAAAARFDITIPGSPVPQTAQTLAVVLVGGFLSVRDAAFALTAYLVLGALGLPVFADGASGPQHLWGPTSGYLVGFWVAAMMVARIGSTEAGKRFLPMAGVMTLAHGVILLLGWTRLALLLGPVEAWSVGVGPFLWGGLVKSAAGAVIVWGALRVRRTGKAT